MSGTETEREFRVVAIDADAEERLIYMVAADAFDEHVVVMAARHQIEQGKEHHVRVYDPYGEIAAGIWLTGDGQLIEYCEEESD